MFALAVVIIKQLVTK